MEPRLTVEAVAKILKISPQHVRGLIQRKQFPFGVAYETSAGKFTYYVFKNRFEAWFNGEDLKGQINEKNMDVSLG